ncbi:MAG: adenylate/guanylate cyclase domain-containing protein, partial [Gammaproteobacteria bacterium]
YSMDKRLRRLGFSHVATAASGDEALNIIRQGGIDLVLLDIMMPTVSGYDVLEKLRADGLLANLPVIVVTALDDLESTVRCIEIGAEDHLTKPVNRTLLEARINATLEKKRLRDEVIQQLAIIRKVFGKYVPDSVAEAIVSGHGELRPTKTIATILYSDIADFTSTVTQLEPERVVQMLNEYFEAVIEPVSRYGGTVNQFQGDAMLITFNVPTPDARHAEHAVKAAIEMQAAHKGREFAGVALETRIGIDTGEVIAGNVGSGERINYTVHGDAVNMASRLEQLNKKHHTSVLVSQTTVDLLGDPTALSPIGEVEVRGRDAPVGLFGLAADA